MKNILDPFFNRLSKPDFYHLSARVFLVVFSVLLISCEDKRIQTIEWIEYEPVYMTFEEFINAVELEMPRDLERPGKIYFSGGYLFVNEKNKGVHVIDNRDPSSPENTGFINIPANKDIAVKGNYLYADSQSDLLVFDIRDLREPALVKRIEGVFETSAERPPGFTTQQPDPSKGVLVDWKPVLKEEVCEGDCHSHPARPFRCTNCSVLMNSFATGDASGASFGESSGGSGTGGSMARFAINGEYLYAVDHTRLITFDISGSPTRVESQQLGWGIETIFPYKNSLFIGSENAMYIYDVTNPLSPKELSIYTHTIACDPVVVEDDFAFITLRTGERCPRDVNRLEVVDVQDLTRPEKVAFYEMINPHGLGIDGGYLFVSEGDHGLKILDARDPNDIRQLRHIQSIRTYDVIPLNGVLMVTGDDGIVQYDYSDINDLELLSIIPVVDQKTGSGS